MVINRVPVGTGLLRQFGNGIRSSTIIERLQNGLIGKDAAVEGPFGSKPLLYADYVASGRSLLQVEQFVMDHVLPYYANSHTEASYCGGFMTRMRREARSVIGELCGADDRYAVIFSGSGATAGLNRLVTLLGVSAAVGSGKRARVIIGPYEHHSKILPWRESGAEIVELPESTNGGPDVAALDHALSDVADIGCVVCTFSAASNVTGIIADVRSLTRKVKAAGAKMVWDYAGAAPYLPINMAPEPGAEIDAAVVSPHKFIGGPGASGVLIVRRDAVVAAKPSWPGGGTVKFVSATQHDYSDKVEVREEAGTPNVVGDIRAALAFLVKDAIGAEYMQKRNDELAQRAIEAWRNCPSIELLGSLTARRLPIFSFRIRNGRGGYVHQQLVTRMLSDRFGIQARGGCACAGPYALRLLDIDAAESERMRQAILAGDEMMKPGFTRLNFSVLLSEEKVQLLLDAVIELAGDAAGFESRYDFDSNHAIFYPRPPHGKQSLSIEN